VKYTLLVTQRCNLGCDYCYIGKRRSRMPLDVAERVVDFAYARTPADEIVEFGFFGGEPLLELELLRRITGLIESHRAHDPGRVRVTIVTNGTIFTPAIAAFVQEHGIAFGVSCDGPPEVQDRHRRTATGRGSARLVERTIRVAAATLPRLMVNSVYRPDTLAALPSCVSYLSSLGVRSIYLSPDFTAQWSAADAAALLGTYRAIADLHCGWYLAGDPHFISLIDTKVAVVLRGGYRPLERCRMGRGEFAFTPDGGIYPCERLVGDGGERHRIGHIDRGLDLGRVLCHASGDGSRNPECLACPLRSCCMNWCGCSNYFASGAYDRVGPFLCASERAAIQVAGEVLERLDGVGAWYDHLSGMPSANVSPRG
jgi:uncharacterized protein